MEPWALRLAHDCQQFGQWPRAGDWFAQDDDELMAMRLALYAEDVFLKGRRGDKWSPEEAEFIVWVGG